MTQTNKYFEYENECRKMFVGQTIQGVIYGEIKYNLDEDVNNCYPVPYYKTKFTDIDTLDHSVYFKTDKETIYVFWDETFISYGLQSKLIDLTEKTNDYEQKWDVSTDQKWKDVLGRKIIEFNIIWEETSQTNINETSKYYIRHPQTFEIKVDNGMTIILTASEFKQIDDEAKVYPLSDNILVTTNIELAKQLKIID